MKRDNASKKIVTVVGARPQFIKCAVLSREIRGKFDEVIIHTGQHYDADMSGVFFDELSIPLPDYNLKIGSGIPGKQTGEMLAAVEQTLMKEEPALALVYGDTNSTLAGALAASKLNIPIAHVEAGLRSFDRRMPEEINRIVTDHVSDLLFAPTMNASTILRQEGILKGVHVVGDVMVDSVNSYLAMAHERSQVMERFGLEEKGYLVATIHRQSNTDDLGNLMSIIRALGTSEKVVVFPVHPRTKKVLMANGLWEKLPPRIMAIEPLGYLDMLRVMSSADKIVTDSGGIQKEAYIMQVPCITARDTTEWVETIKDGWNVLVGTDTDRLSHEINHFRPTGRQAAPFGDGKACARISSVLEEFLER